MRDDQGVRDLYMLQLLRDRQRAADMQRPIPRGPARKLSDEQVKELREWYASERTTLEEVGRRFGVTRERVRQLVNGKDRLEAGGPVTFARRGAATLAPEVVDEVRRRVRNGEPAKFVARDTGVTRSMCADILAGHGPYAKIGLEPPVPVQYRRTTRPARFTEAEALDMRVRVAQGETLASVGRSYGVWMSQVSSITSGRTYKWAPGPITPRAPRLRERDVMKIREEYAAGGESCTSLARRWGRSVSLIQQIVAGKLWPHVGGPLKGDR